MDLFRVPTASAVASPNDAPSSGAPDSAAPLDAADGAAAAEGEAQQDVLRVSSSQGPAGVGARAPRFVRAKFDFDAEDAEELR